MLRLEPPMDPSSESPGSPGVRVIKRYANRKLYDTRDSRYVTLSEIEVLVRGGEDVRIIDNGTKEDLTSVTLAQVLLEQEKKGGRPRGDSRETRRGGDCRGPGGPRRVAEAYRRPGAGGPAEPGPVGPAPGGGPTAFGARRGAGKEI